ncbi:metal ABC transporter permease [Rubidibacter lacunae]|nr:metal ABC transporter permease [Rubidibacter lacunae]
MQRSLVIAIIVGIICALVGSYLMVRRLAMLGDAVSHAVLPGLAIAFMLGGNIYIGAFASGIVSTMAIAWIQTRSRIKEDAAMSIVLSSFFALGIAMITVLQKSNKIDLLHFLFGNILGVSGADVRDTAIVAVLVTVAIGVFYKELLFYTFDPEGAEAAGLPVNLLNFGLTILMALTIVASLKTVGLALVLSLLITPGATAYLIVKRLHEVMFLGAGFGVVSSISGMYLSYYYNLPSGPAIVLVATVFFIVAFCFSPRHGLFTQPRPSQHPEWRILKELRELLR